MPPTAPKLTVNVPTAGRIPGGATVEREVDAGFATTPELRFNLSEADLTTVGRVADSINAKLGAGRARAIDAATVAIVAPQGAEMRTALMGQIEDLLVDPADAPARVIVNARTGTVVINGAVRIAPAAVSHGKLTVQRQRELPQFRSPSPSAKAADRDRAQERHHRRRGEASDVRFAPGASLWPISSRR
jgi:flagellar P-ring protein precursor FlgI